MPLRRARNRRKPRRGVRAALASYTGPNAKVRRTYRGPVNLDVSTPSGAVELVNLNAVVGVSSTGLGVIASEQTFNPNTTNQWASFAARYREYRVLAVKIDYVPTDVVNLGTKVGAPLLIAENKAAPLGTPTSFAQVHSLSRSRVHHVFKRFSYTIRADDYTDLDVGGTASPASEFSMLIFSTGLSNSLQYGFLFITYVVQFSTRQ